MNCPTCGATYEMVHVLGQAAPVASIPTCACPTTVSIGGSYGRNYQFTPSTLTSTTATCVLCGDIVPTGLSVTTAAGDSFCLPCYEKPKPDPHTLIADLLDLQEELKDPG